MDAKELAAALDGHEYGSFPERLEGAAREAGLVVVMGASDDIVDFRGAISDEAEALDGGTVLVDRRGPLRSRAEMDGAEDDELEEWMARKRSAATIEALWCAPGAAHWTYRTAIPHETFRVVDEGEDYCVGMVIRLSDLP